MSMINQDRVNQRILLNYPATGTITNAQQAVSASYAESAGNAVASWNSVTGKPVGLVSASNGVTSQITQITGSLLNPNVGEEAVRVAGVVSIYGSAGYLLLNDGTAFPMAIGNPASTSDPSIQNGGGDTIDINANETQFGTLAGKMYVRIGPTGVLPSGSNLLDLGSTSNPWRRLVVQSITSSIPIATASYAVAAQTLLGSVESASYATVAQTLLGSIESSSFATTASFAARATSASFATTASFAAFSPSSSVSVSSSYASVAQTLLGSIESASYALVAQNVLGSITSASYALTASFALNGGGGGGSETASVALNAGGAAPLFGAAGRNTWWHAAQIRGTSTTGTGPGVNRYRAIPFYGPQRGTIITEIGAFRSNLATAVTQSFAIYTNRGNGENHPDRLITSGTYFSGGTGGVWESVSVASASLMPNQLYWMVHYQAGGSNPTLTGVNTSNAITEVFGYVTSSATNMQTVSLTSGTVDVATIFPNIFPPTIVGNWDVENTWSGGNSTFPLFKVTG